MNEYMVEIKREAWDGRGQLWCDTGLRFNAFVVAEAFAEHLFANYAQVLEWRVRLCASPIAISRSEFVR